MIYVTDSASVPLRRYGSFSYHPASLSDLVAVLRGQRGDWAFAITYPRSLDLIQRWSGIEPSKLPQAPPLDLDSFAYRSVPRVSDGDRILTIRFAQDVVLGHYCNPDSMMKDLLTSQDHTGSEHWMDIDGWELAWLDFRAGTER